MKTLKSFEFKAGAVGGSKHDWDKLFDGGIYQLEEGKDYACKTSTMKMMLRHRAKKRGLLIKVNAVEGGVVVQKVGKDPNYVPPTLKAPKASEAKKAPTPAAK